MTKIATIIPMVSGRMKPTDPKGLIKLREQMLTYYERCGTKQLFTAYICNHCKSIVPTHCPTKDQVSSKGYWDSMTTCLACGRLNFVCIFPSGRTISTKFPSGKSKSENSTEYRHKPVSNEKMTQIALQQ